MVAGSLHSPIVKVSSASGAQPALCLRTCLVRTCVLPCPQALCRPHALHVLQCEAGARGGVESTLSQTFSAAHLTGKQAAACIFTHLVPRVTHGVTGLCI